jgi:hypothetical protein
MVRIALGLSSVIFISLPTWALTSALVSSSSYQVGLLFDDGCRSSLALGTRGQRVRAMAAGDGLTARGHDVQVREVQGQRMWPCRS